MTTDIKPSAATSDTHTPGPWFQNHDDIFVGGDIHDCVAMGLFSDKHNGRSNARRIVACVNACDGISTDGLESAGLGGLHHIAAATFEQRMTRNQLEEQRDELLAALERTLSWLTSYPAEAAMGKHGPYEQARAAIAKARGHL